MANIFLIVLAPSDSPSKVSKPVMWLMNSPFIAMVGQVDMQGMTQKYDKSDVKLTDKR